jgi:hypothetical protein
VRIAQVTLLQSAVLLAIAALLCSVPIQCSREASRDKRRIAAQMLSDWAQELSVMADEPAAWMDEFRPKLRWLAATLLASSSRLQRSDRYDPSEFKRTDAEWVAAHGSDLGQFWARFDRVAARNGFIRRRTGSPPIESRLDMWLIPCWPTFLAIGVLSWGVRRLARGQTAGEESGSA